MKILNLILYSENAPYYIEMKKILETYLNQLHNFKYYFYCYKELLLDQSKEYEISGNVIYLKGNETAVPGILNKTIKVFELANELNIEYDFIVRTNISTVIHFPALQQLLIKDRLNKRIQYAGQKKVIDWLDPPSGLVDETFFNVPFVTGICIILSKNIVNILLSSKEEINYSLIDDVAIGEVLHRKNVSIYNVSNMVLENAPTFMNSKWIYRNKMGNREDDIKRIRFIANNISRFLFIHNMV